MTSPDSTRRSPERGRRRMAVAIGAGVAVLVACVIAAGIARFGGDDGAARTTAATAAPTTASAAATTGPTTTTTASPAAPTAANATAIGRTYAVGTRTLTFVDSSRTTSPNGSFA